MAQAKTWPLIIAGLLLSSLGPQLSTVFAQTNVVTYQGRVQVSGTNFSGTGQFKFVLVTSTNTSTTATATANLSGQFVVGYTVTSGGSGYVSPPTVVVSGGGGSGATAHAVISGSMVTSVLADTAGSGYTSAPTVTIAPPPPNISYTTYWSNDGTSSGGGQPTASVSVPVSSGLFTIKLGDATVPNMSAFDPGLFTQPNLQLRIWFNDGMNGFAVLDPPEPLTPTPYAFVAGSASNVLGTVSASQLSGTIPAAQLSGAYPGALTLSNPNNTFAGTFTGNGAGVTNVSVSSLSLAGAMTNFSIIGWGNNGYGQITIPAGLTNAVAAGAGASHSLALKSDGTVIAWGYNLNGETNVPPGLNNVMAVAAGGNHNLALKNSGTVIAWGSNANGQTNVPAGLSNVIGVAAGGNHSLALKNSGTVIAWGYNGNGQTNVPAGLNNVMAVAAGGNHNLALKNDGTVVAWGYNPFGQTNVPAGLSNVIALAAGANHSLALKNDGKGVAWGDNGYGQTNVPPGLSNVIALAAGANHSLALKNDGKGVAWGDNGYGQTNVPPGLNNIVALAPGCYASHVLVLQKQILSPVALLNGPNTFDGINTFNGSVQVNGGLSVSGLLRSGSETGTSQPPDPAGLVIRRINTTAVSSNSVVALAHSSGNATDIKLVRDGSFGGFQIQIPALPGYITIAAMGMDNVGAQRNFYTTVASGPQTIQLYSNAQNVVHFQCTFGLTYSAGAHLTQVTLSRYSGDSFWSGTLISTYNQ